MHLPVILMLAFLIGCVCGLRSMTGPALVCWGAHLGWLDIPGSKLGLLAATPSTIVFSILAIGELIADKLPFIPSRTEIGPLAVRFFFGGMCGAAICIAAGASSLVGVVLGGFGGIGAAYVGYHLRRWLTVRLHLPDIVVALVEDVIAVGGGFLVIARF